MVLENFIKKSPNIRKLFGKKELEIVIKQLNGNQLTQSEKNRLSKDIRPKFKCISELNKFQDEFQLKKNQNNKRTIQKALNVILQDKEKNNILAILLFGSFANNTFTNRSDIDIAALFKNTPSKEAITQFRIRVSGELPDKIDIQVFNTLPAKVKKGIAKNHKLLHATEEFDNVNFSIQHLKNNDFFLRKEKIFGTAT